MPSIGELWVDLGFNVDDQKLKDFNSGLKDAAGSILQLAGITASVAGFTSLLNGAANTATELKNLNIQFGVTEKSAQSLASAISSANPLVSYEQGLQSVKHVAEYIRDMQTGKGGNELGLFGGSAADDTPDKVVARIRKNWDAVVNNTSVARATELATAILGTAGAVNMLTESEMEFQKGLERGVVDQKSLDNLTQYNTAITNLGIAFDQLKASWLAVPAEKIANFLQGAQNGTLTYNDSLWGKFVKGTDETLTNAGHAMWEGILTVTNPRADADIIHDVAWGTGNSPQKPNTPRQKIIDFFMSKGRTKAQAEGIADGINAESGYDFTNDPRKHGRTENAYGLAQWQVPRQKNFAKWAGHDIHSSTFDEQLEFMNYELTKGLEQKAGAALSNTKTREEARASWRENFERPAGSGGVVVNITNQLPQGASAHEFGQVTATSMQNVLNSFRAQNGIGAIR